MGRLSLLCLSFIVTIGLCDGYKILAVFPLPSKSHGILGDNMVKHLVNAGHEVHYITPFIRKDVPPNLHQVDISENQKLFNENSMNVKLIMDGVFSLQDSYVLFNMMKGISEHTLQNPNVQKLMRTEKFDLVIGEFMFSYIYSAFGAVFQCPFIWFSTIEPHSVITNLVDGPLNPAYNSDYLNARISPYSLWGRAHELYTLVVALYRASFTYYNAEEKNYLEFIAPAIAAQGRPVPVYEDLKYNASLVLGNTQVVLGLATSLPACYKHIGGYHIDEDVKPLPENLKKILDNAKNGLIYFSMGSNVKSKDLPDELKKGLLKMFGTLKQTVIWKFEDNLSNVPQNVHIVQWAPQQSILAHKNVALFITHGGLLSITEAIHFGVPLITVPVFADQFLNARRADEKGFAKHVPLSYNLVEDLKVALDEVLHNPKYALKAKELSVALHDRQQSPKDELNFWVQHVVRTRGAPHLRSPAITLPIYQRVYLDLLAVVLFGLLALFVMVKKILCTIFSKKCNVKQKKH